MADIDSYYLSSKNSLNSNKEYIIVKLTDSALKCLEECQNLSKNGSGKSPSIKFMGNHGFLSFPTSGTNSNQPVEQKFSFSIADIEGPQGAFECVQQSHGQMNVLGALQYKMIIQAKEDVFAQARTAMTIAAEMQNTRRTREIKPSQTDIGRKVIKPSSKSLYRTTTTSSSSSSSISSGTPNLSLKNHTMQNRLPLPGLSGSGSQANNNSSLSQSSSSFSTSLSSSLLGGINERNSCKDDDGIGDRGGGGGYNNHHDSHSSYSNNYGSTIPASNNNNDTNSRLYHRNPVNGVVSNDCNDSLHNNRNAGQAHNRNPDIMKRSIKERLIHLLALRPFKKPELYARITSEGIRDRDKTLISNVIKTISHVRDNAFVLNRHIWNDVHEDWPFYTESEKQILKRRKPQNLTPPLSSDGGSSSASGQSPGSTHNGSPPPAVKRPSSTIANLNNSNDNYSEPTIKKPRISRVKIPERVSSGPMRSSSASLYDHSRELINPRPRDDDYYGPNAHESEDSGMGSLTYSVLRNEPKRSSSSSLTPPMMELSSNGVNMNGATGSPKNAAILNDGSRKHMANQMMASSNNNKNNNLNISNNYDTNVQSNVVSSMGTGGNNPINSSNNYSTSPKLQPQQPPQQQSQQQQHNPTIQPITNKASSPGSAINSNTSLQSVSSNNNNNNNNSSRNLISEYPQITSVEQRRRYKTEFDNDYAEYLQLHSIIENVSKRFAQLEEELRNVKHNDKKYKEIKKQILKEYRENTDNSSFIEKKSRFQHLHEKLKHIKHLVGEFDKCLEQQNGNVTAPATATY